MSGKDGGGAFPIMKAIETNGVWNECVQGGMSLLDYFAAKAMQIVYASNPDLVFNNSSHIELFAKKCYALSTAMLKEKECLEREGS